ncbi:MAG: fumarylacetoacetate hydrolase family protein, partial [Flavobacteriaceae bacterium]
QKLNFELIKNDLSVQRANTQLMLYTIDQLIAYVSQFFTLKIGDILFTGTPAGVAAVQENDYLEGFLEGQKLLDVKVK